MLNNPPILRFVKGQGAPAWRAILPAWCGAPDGGSPRGGRGYLADLTLRGREIEQHCSNQRRSRALGYSQLAHCFETGEGKEISQVFVVPRRN